MKKMLALLLGVMMLLTACSALAEGTDGLMFQTLGEAMDAAGESPIEMGTDQNWAVALEKDGKYIRVVAEMDDKARELCDAVMDAEDFEAAFAARDAYIRELPVAYVEEFTVAPKDQAEIDAFVGKTLKDLEEAGYSYAMSGTRGETDEIVFTMANGVYSYDFVVDTDLAGYDAHLEQDSFEDLVVKSAAFAGLSDYAAELWYHADGTVEEPEDPFAEYNAMMSDIEEALAAAGEGNEVDVEAVVSKIAEKYPESEDAIRFLIMMYSLMGDDDFSEDEYAYYPDDEPEAEAYVSTWVAEDGDWRIEVYGEDGGLKLMVVHRLGDNKEDVWEYAAMLNEEKTGLTCVPFGLHYRQDTVSGAWDETYYEDGDATFTLNEEGRLLWADLKEDAGKGLAFEKIGNFYGGRWMKDDIDVYFYDWYDGRYDIRAYKRGENEEILADAILQGEYDAETDSVTAEGFFDPDAPFTVTFSYDELRNLVWTEDGVSTVMDYSYIVD